MISRNELRTSILSRVDTFTEHVEWIGGSADLAFADSVVALIDYVSERARQEGRDEAQQEQMDRENDNFGL